MKKAFERWFGRRAADATTMPRRAIFKLMYSNALVAELTIDGGEWTFRYSDEVRSGKKSIRPLPEFPDVTKTYQTKNLWAFFSTRIPSIKRDAIKEIVRAESLPADDQVAMLRRFGRRTVTNPFELVEEPALAGAR